MPRSSRRSRRRTRRSSRRRTRSRYKGRKIGRKRRKSRMQCNTPVKSWLKGKKRAVKACVGGKERLLHYGAVGYKHNYSKKANRNFRRRHRCDTNPSKLTRRYWACEDLWPVR